MSLCVASRFDAWQSPSQGFPRAVQLFGLEFFQLGVSRTASPPATSVSPHLAAGEIPPIRRACPLLLPVLLGSHPRQARSPRLVRNLRIGFVEFLNPSPNSVFECRQGNSCRHETDRRGALLVGVVSSTKGTKIVHRSLWILWAPVALGDIFGYLAYEEWIMAA